MWSDCTKPTKPPALPRAHREATAIHVRTQGKAQGRPLDPLMLWIAVGSNRPPVARQGTLSHQDTRPASSPETCCRGILRARLAGLLPSSAGLAIVQDGLWCGFAQFKLRAHLRDLCILLCHPLVHGAKRRFQFLYLAVLFEELVEQHRVHRVVPYRVWFSTFIRHDQRRIHLRDFFSDQTKLRPFPCIGLVMESDRSQ